MLRDLCCRSSFFIVFLVAFLVHSVSCYAASGLRINVDRGRVKPMSLLVATFFSDSKATSELGDNIIKVMKADLLRSALFSLVENSAASNVDCDSVANPVSDYWKSIRADMMFSSSLVTVKGSAKIKMVFRVWDMTSGGQLVAKSMIFESYDWRRISHIVADFVYSRLTGEAGYFDTKIAYIAQSGIPPKVIRRIAITDQDGANTMYLTDGRRFVMTPRFSPDVRKLIYLTYVRNKGAIMVRDLRDGHETVIGNIRGLPAMAVFSPDGKTFLLSNSFGGGARVCSYNPKTGTLKFLTGGGNRVISASASYSPDQRRIVFASNRDGTRQLYVMHRDGSHKVRISFGRGSYSTPIWSPRGDWIAFTKREGRRFYIGVMRADGSQERLLSSGYIVESPSWAPNGRILIFSKTEYIDASRASVGVNLSTRYKYVPRSTLHTVDITGNNEMMIYTAANAFEPDWSRKIGLGN